MYCTQVIGVTLETRPDFITRAELRRFRRYGCTRVQASFPPPHSILSTLPPSHAHPLQAVLFSLPLARR